MWYAEVIDPEKGLGRTEAKTFSFACQNFQEFSENKTSVYNGLASLASHLLLKTRTTKKSYTN